MILQGFLTLKLQVFSVLSILRYFPRKISVNLLLYGNSSYIKKKIQLLYIAILGIWVIRAWLTRGKYGICVAVRGSYGGLTGSTWRPLEILPRKISTFYCRVSYVTVTRIPSLVLRNTWHYVIIRRRKFLFPKFVLRCSLRGGFIYAKVWPRH